MATTTEIEQLKKQLKKKGEEIGEIYAKLVKAGVTKEFPDDFLDQLIF